MVPLTNTDWTPPIPHSERLKKRFDRLLASSTSATDKALDLILDISRWQYFEDGNKRTALFGANRILLQAGAGLFAIPENKMHRYQSKLQKYDRQGDRRNIKNWMYENCLFGTESDSQAYATH